MMKIRLVLGMLLVALVLAACGDNKPPMVPDQEQMAQPDASAD